MDQEYPMPRTEMGVCLSGGLMPISKPGSHRILKMVERWSVLSLGHKGSQGNSTSCNSHINNWGLIFSDPLGSPGQSFLAMLSS